MPSFFRILFFKEITGRAADDFVVLRFIKHDKATVDGFFEVVGLKAFEDGGSCAFVDQQVAGAVGAEAEGEVLPCGRVEGAAFRHQNRHARPHGEEDFVFGDDFRLLFGHVPPSPVL